MILLVDKLHPDIKNFIGDLSENNIKIHKIGNIISITFKKTKISLFFEKTIQNTTELNIIKFENKKYYEEEFLKNIQLKAYW